MSGNMLIVLIILGGWGSGALAQKLKLPAVLGMTLFGLILGSLAGGYLPPEFARLAPYLKSLALVIILLRAGLGLSTSALRQAGRTAILLSLLPCLGEGTAAVLLYHFWAGLPWTSALAGGALMAAVSPAVVIPSMLSLRERGFGEQKQVPTAVLAGATMDNVIVIALFTVFMQMASGEGASLATALITIPYGVIGGILPGLAAGWLLARWFKRHRGSNRGAEQMILLIGTAFLLLEAGNIFQTTALLGVIAAGFMLLYRAEHEAHQLAGMLRQAWTGAEIVLFVLIGLSVDIGGALSSGLFALGIITAGLAVRSLGVLAATWRSGLSFPERLFCVIAYLPKATVQAALASVPLARGVVGGELILATSVSAILITAPAGLILLRNYGEALLAAPETNPAGEC